MTTEITNVYNLYYTKDFARTLAISCSSMEILQKQLIGICLKSENMEPRFKLAIEMYLPDIKSNWNRIIDTFKTAQASNIEPLGFDLYWEEEPQVLL
jgi:hypothetical protein